MAVLYRRPGSHGCIRGIRPGPNLRLPRRRCRLRAVRHGPLHRKHRNHAAALSRNLQEQLLRRRFAEPVAGLDAAGAGAGASEAGSADPGGASQEQVTGGAGVMGWIRSGAASSAPSLRGALATIAVGTLIAERPPHRTV